MTSQRRAPNDGKNGGSAHFISKLCHFPTTVPTTGVHMPPGGGTLVNINVYVYLTKIKLALSQTQVRRWERTLGDTHSMMRCERPSLGTPWLGGGFRTRKTGFCMFQISPYFSGRRLHDSTKGSASRTPTSLRPPSPAQPPATPCDLPSGWADWLLKGRTP
jgi:hypothetical protein